MCHGCKRQLTHRRGAENAELRRVAQSCSALLSVAQSCSELLSIDTNDRMSLRTSAFCALSTGTRRPLATSTRDVAKPHLLELISGPWRRPRLRGIGLFCWAATLTPTLSRERERE